MGKDGRRHHVARDVAAAAVGVRADVGDRLVTVTVRDRVGPRLRLRLRLKPYP